METFLLKAVEEVLHIHGSSGIVAIREYCCLHSLGSDASMNMIRSLGLAKSRYLVKRICKQACYGSHKNGKYD